MEKGDRIQWACGHWLVAGEYGIQDDSVKDVPTKRCGPCQNRLREAAPQLLEALEAIEWAGEIAGSSTCPSCGSLEHEPHSDNCQLAAAIELAK